MRWAQTGGQRAARRLPVHGPAHWIGPALAVWHACFVWPEQSRGRSMRLCRHARYIAWHMPQALALARLAPTGDRPLSLIAPMLHGRFGWGGGGLLQTMS